MAEAAVEQTGCQKLWLLVRKYPIGTKLSSTITKPSADSHAAGQSNHRSREQRKRDNRPRDQRHQDLRILMDMAWQRGSGEALTCVAQIPPIAMPIVRKIQPIVTTRPFIASSTWSDGSRVEVAEVLRFDLLEEQHVGDAQHAGEREARVGEQHGHDVEA